MFERVSNDEITSALDELMSVLGIAEEIPVYVFVVPLRKKDTEGCVQEIATRLGLPIRIRLSYVPKTPRPGDTDGFRSSALARTDWTGHGIGAITAQVSIPRWLPMFGTRDLQGYPIQVRVSENCHAHPYTFVSTMVHELSHVLLASLRSPRKDSELHTDLVPILLGFGDVVRRGRKTIEVSTRGNITTTRTTTYGYLTDAQFEVACDHAAGLVKQHAGNKKRLLQLAGETDRKVREAGRALATFHDYLEYLDNRRPRRMKKEHAQRLVELHGRDCASEWQGRITAARKRIEGAEAFVQPLNHYTSGRIAQVSSHTRLLELASDELDQVTDAVINDNRILRKYVGFLHRLRRALSRRSR
jgi:hypothetical protein